MNIREQIGYPDYILEEANKHLDEEYSNVRIPMGAPRSTPRPGALQSPTCPLTTTQPAPEPAPGTLSPQLPGVDPS